MARGKCRRWGRNREGNDGSKQKFFELDADMVDVPRPRTERQYQNQDGNSGSHTQHERNNRRRVGKASRTKSQAPQSVFSSFPHTPGQPTTQANAFNSAFPNTSPFANTPRRNTHRASIGTCVSALSTQAGGRSGPYCYRCADTNRKLRQALVDLLETTMHNGKKLIDEWAWEAGVSLDHMDCERTKMRIVPEGLRSECEPCNRRKAQMMSHGQSSPRSVAPPTQDPRRVRPVGTPVPFDNGLHQQQPFPQPQQKLNPFIQPTVPDHFTRQASPVSVPQYPRLMSWTVPGEMPSIPEQGVAYTPSAEYQRPVAHPQAQQYLYHQPQQGLSGGHTWEPPGSCAEAQYRHHPLQEQQRPYVDQAWAQALHSAGVLNHTQPRDPLAAQLAHEVQEPTQPQTPPAPTQQHPLDQHQQQPQPRASHLGNPFTNSTGPALMQEEQTPMVPSVTEQAPFNTLISPPHSNEMTIPGMLNDANEAQQPAQTLASSAGVRAGSEASVQSIEQEQVPGGVEDPALGRGEISLPSVRSESEPEFEQQPAAAKSCCEVIAAYALPPGRE